jgi:hypothetical protein
MHRQPRWRRTIAGCKAGLHDWHAGWIDALVSAHEGGQGDNPGAGG